MDSRYFCLDAEHQASLALRCGNSPDVVALRTFRMGFQNSAPRYDDFDLVLQSLNTWTIRADAAMISTELPWAALFSGTKATQFVTDNYVGLVEFYRTKNLKLWVYIDPANGLNRASDSNELVTLGKSIADPDVQQIYQRFVVVMDSMLQPDHIGLALETNLIRQMSSNAIYQGVVTAANHAATELKARNSKAKLSMSIQADFAWTYSPTQPSLGIAQDFIDFPFSEEMGISSYPYFSKSKPSDLPLDYYSKIFLGKTIPVFATEGGWSSLSIPGPNNTTIPGSTQLQQEYISRQSQMLDKVKAIGWFQLTFTDIDLASLPSTVDPTIQYFAYLGLLDANMKSKPALATWDAIFSRTLGK